MPDIRHRSVGRWADRAIHPVRAVRRGPAAAVESVEQPGQRAVEEALGALLALLPGEARPGHLEEPLADDQGDGHVGAGGVVLAGEEGSGDPDEVSANDEQDPMYEEAMRVVMEMGKASTSTLQRRLRLGYGRAARILDMMYRDGIIGPPDGSKPREVLKRPDWLREVDHV